MVNVLTTLTLIFADGWFEISMIDKNISNKRLNIIHILHYEGISTLNQFRIISRNNVIHAVFEYHSIFQNELSIITRQIDHRYDRIIQARVGQMEITSKHHRDKRQSKLICICIPNARKKTV